MGGNDQTQQNIWQLCDLQETLKRKNLRQELELNSSDRDKQVQRAFATALQMQQKSEEEAATLKAELGRAERKRLEDINALMEQVIRRD